MSSHQSDVVSKADERAYLDSIRDFYHRAQQPNAFSSVEGANDPNFYSRHRKMDLMQGATIRYGKIHNTIPHLGWYKVAVDSLGMMACCRAYGDTSASLFGVMDTSVLPPDCLVAVAISPSMPWGYILGVMSQVVTDANYKFSDWLVQAGHVGYTEDYHSAPITNLADQGGAYDFSHNQNMDALSTDWGRATTTGLQIHLDPFLATMRVDEICGLSLFYPEGLTRLGGHQLQIYSDAEHTEHVNDEGELSTFKGSSPYPWEMLGAFDKDTQVHTENSAQVVQIEREKAALEPAAPDQQPFYRYEEYGGYLGQGHIRQMSAPPKNAQGTNTLSGTQAPIGVFREYVGLDGEYFVASAKSVTLAKTSVITMPKRKKLPNDLTDEADNNSNYKAAGAYGDGAEHKISDITSDDTENANAASVLGVMDKVAHVDNYKSLLGFSAHEKDFNTPEASAAPIGAAETIDFSQLMGKAGFPSETPENIKIDSRMQANFYKLLQMLHFTEDGGVILQGGHGEQIRFCRGEVYIDAPSHVHIRSGKNTVMLAGDDAIIRAKNSVDVTASDKDVRIKAEHNLQMLAGNGQTGGVLIESRSTGSSQTYPQEGGEKVESSGIVLKSANGVANITAQNIYLRTGNSEGEVGAGDIVLDAAKGQSNIKMISNNNERYMKGSAKDSFNFPQVSSVNTFTASGAQLASSLFVKGQMNLASGLRSRGGIVTTDGDFQSPGGGQPGKLRDPMSERDKVIELENATDTAKQTQRVSYEDGIKNVYYGSGQIGADQTQKSMSFSMRSAEDYGTTEFTTLIPHWNILAAGGNGVTTWVESTIAYQGEQPTLPWPGKDAWEGETMLQISAGNHTLYDFEAGHAKDRGEIYHDAKFGTVEKVVPKEKYLIIQSE